MPRKSKQARIAPLEPPYDHETATALELLGPPIQLFRVFARRPDLARGITGWGRYYLSRRSALTPAQVRSLAQGGPDDACWTDPADRAVIRAVDELRETSDLTDDTWTELDSTVGEMGALDLLLLCGWYHAISFAVRALRLP